MGRGRGSIGQVRWWQGKRWNIWKELSLTVSFMLIFCVSFVVIFVPVAQVDSRWCQGTDIQASQEGLDSLSDRSVQNKSCYFYARNQRGYRRQNLTWWSVFQIGVILRDSHGVAQVRYITGNKILRILKAKGINFNL